MHYHDIVDFALEYKGEIDILIPTSDEMVTVNDAVGSIVEWPTKLVMLMGDTLIFFLLLLTSFHYVTLYFFYYSN